MFLGEQGAPQLGGAYYPEEHTLVLTCGQPLSDVLPGSKPQVVGDFQLFLPLKPLKSPMWGQDPEVGLRPLAPFAN